MNIIHFKIADEDFDLPQFVKRKRIVHPPPTCKVPLEVRLLRRMEPELNSGCWLWTGALSKAPSGQSYGHIQGNNKKLLKAHRASYECFVGPIPEGLKVLHTCDTPPCINPNHLFLGTHKDNMRDMRLKGRAYSFVGLINPKSKLTLEDVLKVRDDPRPHRVIAEAFGVGRTQIGRIKRREIHTRF